MAQRVTHEFILEELSKIFTEDEMEIVADRHDWFDFLNEGFDCFGWGDDAVKIPDQLKHLHQEGGGEGGAENCFAIFELNGVCYKFCYSYYSYSGYYWDFDNGYQIVQPKQVMTTIYE